MFVSSLDPGQSMSGVTVPPIEQHPPSPAGDIERVPDPQPLIVVGPPVHETYIQSRAVETSIRAVGLTVQPNVSLPANRKKSTSSRPETTPDTVISLLSQSLSIPSDIAMI